MKIRDKTCDMIRLRLDLQEDEQCKVIHSFCKVLKHAKTEHRSLNIFQL